MSVDLPIYQISIGHIFFNVGHFGIANYILGGFQDFVSAEKDSQREYVVSALREDLDAANFNIVLSSEHFSSRLLTQGCVDSLSELLSGYDCSIVCYVRRQDEMILGGYSTAVYYGRREKLSIDEAWAGNPYFDYMQFLPLWENAFGKENIIVRKYGRSEDGEWDIRRDFLEVLNVPIELPEEGLVENASLDFAEVETLRLINQSLPSFSSDNRLAFERAQVVRGLIRPFLPTGKPLRSLLSWREAKSIMDRFADSNAELERRYMVPGALADWASFATAKRTSRDRRAASRSSQTLSDLAAMIAALGEELRQVVESRETSRGNS
ncbi:hypothetical protein LJE71_07080 [Xanthobacter autotrophicus]|uniref:hypothetical protein n=1 Tax=Xanthobacter autotrophicus TaxID=280 RepID=UPI001E63CBCB|nr:hypothetical protein [Xanthobacter autotrophicus]UDQ90754.1 hypothetical protein LJE71_07080 [Xanthobacter autotrophicus]